MCVCVYDRGLTVWKSYRCYKILWIP